MSNDDYYRQQASDAQTQADRALGDADRAAWLRIAQSWMALISRPLKTAKESFDEAARDKGTHQDVSKESQ